MSQLIEGSKLCDFWVHVLGFSREANTIEVAKAIWEMFSGLYEVELRENRRPELCFIYLWVSVGVTCPLRRAMVLLFPHKVTIIIRYERLLHFCQYCGCLLIL